MVSWVKTWQKTKVRDSMRISRSADLTSPTIASGEERWGIEFNGMVTAAQALAAPGQPIVGGEGG
jgi:hypothetical protein